MDAYSKIINAVGAKDWSETTWWSLFPDLALAKQTPQSPIYHGEGDVWTHTLMVLDSLHGLEEFKGANKEDQLVLCLAAMLHDISKAFTEGKAESPVLQGGDECQPFLCSSRSS